MTTHVDRTIAALRAQHDRLAELVARSSEETLAARSGAQEWSVADVLSHLGSGAEIMRMPILAAIDGTPAPEGGMQPIWDRWNALAPRDQATQYVEHDARYVETVEALDAAQRGELLVDVGFLPEPVPLEVALGMRLDEVALHAWDVQVATDPSAVVDGESAELLLELMGGSMSFLLGFLGKPDQLSVPARVAVAGHVLEVAEGVSLTARGATDGADGADGADEVTATWSGPTEAFVRLVGGRLGPAHTPDGVSVTGNVGLDDLRAVFPGF
ncbi:MAG: maleylpyruvate isomerase family mycothiol-dependent enzyme [Nocardioides sp.]|uniref:maleylpyruvate isomerase family mycothiol-dependent enzyme n=1 Tax=Nocardioides sp. TaxID=35761 RepID=UPI0023A70A32|nr:maleylpyruvate isomerase family mycothiol-dependent enzyme [Nocardioides sp.]MDE0775356.1 maleylpyruvate isomerase family mycothiol-dependent enzyme [Nocardioides sp.]